MKSPEPSGEEVGAVGFELTLFGDDDHDGLIAICDGDFDSPGLDANLDYEHPNLLSGHLLTQVAFVFAPPLGMET